MIHGIRDQIFMGAGDHSLAQMGYMHQQLERAFTILNGIQQPPSIHESAEACRQFEVDVEDGQLELERIAGEIYVGLTGKRPKTE